MCIDVIINCVIISSIGSVIIIIVIVFIDSYICVDYKVDIRVGKWIWEI